MWVGESEYDSESERRASAGIERARLGMGSCLLGGMSECSKRPLIERGKGAWSVSRVGQNCMGTYTMSDRIFSDFPA